MRARDVISNLFEFNACSPGLQNLTANPTLVAVEQAVTGHAATANAVKKPIALCLDQLAQRNHNFNLWLHLIIRLAESVFLHVELRGRNTALPYLQWHRGRNKKVC